MLPLSARTHIVMGSKAGRLYDRIAAPLWELLAETRDGVL